MSLLQPNDKEMLQPHSEGQGQVGNLDSMPDGLEQETLSVARFVSERTEWGVWVFLSVEGQKAFPEGCPGPTQTQQ